MLRRMDGWRIGGGGVLDGNIDQNI